MQLIHPVLKGCLVVLLLVLLALLTLLTLLAVLLALLTLLTLLALLALLRLLLSAESAHCIKESGAQVDPDECQGACKHIRHTLMMNLPGNCALQHRCGLLPAMTRVPSFPR